MSVQFSSFVLTETAPVTESGNLTYYAGMAVGALAAATLFLHTLTS